MRWITKGWEEGRERRRGGGLGNDTALAAGSAKQGLAGKRELIRSLQTTAVLSGLSLTCILEGMSGPCRPQPYVLGLA